MENLWNQYIEDQKTRFHEGQLFSQPREKKTCGRDVHSFQKKNARENFLLFEYNLADKLSKCYLKTHGNNSLHIRIEPVRNLRLIHSIRSYLLDRRVVYQWYLVEWQTRVPSPL
jgi:hypothetical protein